jgi:hypothetical protein
VLLAAYGTALAEQSKADLLFEEGRKLEAAGKYQEACDKFAAAIQLDPEAPGTLLNLGLCNEKLGHLAAALAYYKQAEEHAKTYGQKEYQEKAAEQTRALEARVPVVKLEFAAELPAGAEVRVDDKALRSEEYARFTVDPGKHKVVISAPKVKTFTSDVDVAEGSEKTVKVEKWVTVHKEMQDPGHGKRLAAYGLGGGALVLFGVDLYVGLHERSIYNGATGPNMLKTQQDAKDTVRLWSTVTFSAGVVAAGAAVYLFLTTPKAHEVEVEGMLLPVVGPDQIGLAYDRRF